MTGAGPRSATTMTDTSPGGEPPPPRRSSKLEESRPIAIPLTSQKSLRASQAAATTTAEKRSSVRSLHASMPVRAAFRTAKEALGLGVSKSKSKDGSEKLRLHRQRLYHHQHRHHRAVSFRLQFGQGALQTV